MKKLAVLIGFLMLSLSSFSQTDTTKVVIPTKTARLIVADLIRYDGCKFELELTKEKIAKLQEREAQKDTIIKLLNDKDENNKFIIRQQELQIGQYEHLTDDLTKEIKSKKRSTVFWKMTTGVTTFFSIYLLLK
jgi:hypothetical protein